LSARRRFSTEIFQKGGKFQRAKNNHPKTTNPPQKHHKLTTKNHPENTSSPTTPLKNNQKNPKKGPLHLVDGGLAFKFDRGAVY
jgi:hypothetical protein